jgi:death on curing protein
MHKDAISIFGGRLEGYNESLVDGAVHAPQNAYYYKFDGRGVNRDILIVLAAYYWFHLSCDHPFADGNKRTAYLAAKTFLLINGYTLSVTYEVGLNVSLAVATSRMTKEQIAARIRPYVLERTDASNVIRKRQKKA